MFESVFHLLVPDVGFVALGPLAVVLLGSVLPSVLTAVGVIGASRSQSSASRNATNAQTAANNRALDQEREQDAADRAELERADEENRRRWDIKTDRDQARYDTSINDARRNEAQALRWKETTDRRLGPYRDHGVAALQQLGALAGLQVRPSADTPNMTGGWTDGELAPPEDLPPATASGRRGMSSLAGGR